MWGSVIKRQRQMDTLCYSAHDQLLFGLVVHWEFACFRG